MSDFKNKNVFQLEMVTENSTRYYMFIVTVSCVGSFQCMFLWDRKNEGVIFMVINY